MVLTFCGKLSTRFRSRSPREPKSRKSALKMRRCIQAIETRTTARSRSPQEANRTKTFLKRKKNRLWDSTSSKMPLLFCVSKCRGAAPSCSVICEDVGSLSKDRVTHDHLSENRAPEACACSVGCRRPPPCDQ